MSSTTPNRAGAAVPTPRRTHGNLGTGFESHRILLTLPDLRPAEQVSAPAPATIVIPTPAPPPRPTGHVASPTVGAPSSSVNAAASPLLTAHSTATQPSPQSSSHSSAQRTWRTDQARRPSAPRAGGAWGSAATQRPYSQARSAAAASRQSAARGFWYAGIAAAAACLLTFITIEGPSSILDRKLPPRPVEDSGALKDFPATPVQTVGPVHNAAPPASTWEPSPSEPPPASAPHTPAPSSNSQRLGEPADVPPWESWTPTGGIGQLPEASKSAAANDAIPTVSQPVEASSGPFDPAPQIARLPATGDTLAGPSPVAPTMNEPAANLPKARFKGVIRKTPSENNDEHARPGLY
ncbi:MAG TPA: hypothetical protein VHZ24_20355 [Pirellulales bacterium]|jgi:hypothetical protein|nr:hypothetical protein [Pirellulales bacterium]